MVTSMIFILRTCQAILLSALVIACSNKEPTAEQKRQETKNSIATDAWLAGQSFADALQECRIAGFSSIEKCADNDGILWPEEMAKMAAERALTSIKEYKATCNKAFTIAYCNALIKRAIAIEWRRIIYEKNEKSDQPDEDDRS